MPILPLDHPQPLYATIGLMLYPATDELDPPKARAFAAHKFAKLIRHLDESGFPPTYEALLRVVLDADETPDVADLRIASSVPERVRCRNRERTRKGVDEA